MNTRVIRAAKVTVPPKKVYLRMGYTLSYKPNLMIPRDKYINDMLNNALDQIRANIAFLIIPGIEVDRQTVKFDGNNVFSSIALADMLKGCSDMVLIAASIDKDFISTIKDKIAQGKMTDALIYDSCASEVVDEALSFGLQIIDNELKSSGGKTLKRRFSAGYGDFNIESQKVIYDYLDLDKLDVQITNTYMLKPEKTVTAVTGIKY
ncbi:MAG: hypothetical protein PHP69_06525 [Candidatus Omnitrophica bacterium]|jgi:hypothetical protein|nr:hypothetical protein [Candidatus Omnitrophota bacterium]